ncbi:hypothetical protein AgCh_033946 [Apium graveolens]
MEGNFIGLLVLLLAFSQLLSLNAVPLTRTRSLMHQLHGHAISEDNHLAHVDRGGKVKTVIGRMNLVELNDYPGSGANNRHSRRRSCIDC